MASESTLSKFITGFRKSTSSQAGAAPASKLTRYANMGPNPSDMNPSGFLRGSKTPPIPNTPRGNAIKATWGSKK